jgi:acetyl esterase/lipase
MRESPNNDGHYFPGTESARKDGLNDTLTYFLTKNMMKWFWDNYTTSETDRNNILASPLRATTDQLKDFPPTLIQTAELDVLRDEGEAFGRKLDSAGVVTTGTPSEVIASTDRTNDAGQFSFSDRLLFPPRSPPMKAA